MYRKTTFEKQEQKQKTAKKEVSDIRKSENLDQSQLFYRDIPGSIYQIFDIHMPYLILYEVFNVDNDYSDYLEFSENNMISWHNTFSAYDARERKLHSHNFYELTFVISGELTLQIEDEYVTYRQGECCLCNKNIHHLENTDRNVEFAAFLFQEDYLRKLFKDNIYYDKAGKVRSRKTVFDVFFEENSKNTLYDAKMYIDFQLKRAEGQEFFLQQFNQLVEEITTRHSGKSHMMKALFCRFFEMLEDETLYQAGVHWAKLSTEEQIVYQISKAYEEKLGLFTRQEIEAITGYHGDYVERIMKKSVGKTLSEYGRDFMMKKAGLLLTQTNITIGELCEQMGYTNRSFFNHIFKEYYGMLPSQYRNQ